VFIGRVILPESNKINVIKELLKVKYNFASVPVLDLADIVFSIGLPLILDKMQIVWLGT